MKRFHLLVLVFICGATFSEAQKSVNKAAFFADTSMIDATLTMNFRKAMAKRDKEGYIFPAEFAFKLGDSINVDDKIDVEVRGHFRRSYCYIPPLKLIFKNNPSSAFHHMHDLKLVNTCSLSSSDDQNILKEFLVYKIYNLITDKSFRVRLLNLNYKDSSGKKPTITRHAFLLEDIKDLAKRNNCSDWSSRKFRSEATDRRQMTTVSIFEYMIGNTDWSVPGGHNMKIVHANDDSLSRPYVIPYDFDYSGFVNTNYAVPDEQLHIASVRIRVYRSQPRTLEETNLALEKFKQQKENIYSLVKNFNLLTPNTKKDVISYLDEFYKVLDNPYDIKYEFITNALAQ